MHFYNTNPIFSKNVSRLTAASYYERTEFTACRVLNIYIYEYLKLFLIYI